VGGLVGRRSEQIPQERLIRAERAIVPVRIGIIALNSFVYTFLLDQRPTIRWLAYSLIAIAWVYAAFVVIFEPYRRLPRLWSYYATSVFDGILAVLWIHATGGWNSPFYVLLFATVSSIAVRFNLRYTLLAATLYSASYIALLALRGEIAGRVVELAIRVSYIYIVAVLCGVVAREAVAEASGRRAVRRLVAVTSTIAQELEPSVVLGRLGAAARELTKADRVAIFLVQRDREVSCAYREGLSVDACDEVGRMCWELRGPLEHVEDAATHPALAHLHGMIEREGIHTIASLPLLVHGTQNGLLALYRNVVWPFSAEELDVARALADQAAVIIENARLVTDLRREAALARVILESAPGGILYYGAGQLFANPHAVAFFGAIPSDVGPEHLVGQYLHPNGQPLTREELPLSRAVAGQASAGVELIILHPSGRRIPVLVNAEPIRADHLVIGAVAVHQDISALKALDSVRDEYVALVSHDLRSPMTAIRLHAEMLRQALAEHDLSREALSADAILSNVGRAARLIQDLVDSTRLESGHMPMQRVPLDLGALLRRVLAELPTPDAARLVLEPALEAAPLVLADGASIERVVVNLINNALKYSPPRTPVVVRLWRRADQAIVSVIDRGPGIPPEDQPRVFDKYFRAPSQQRTEGLGLGLYICRLIVDAHGGHIWVESAPGEGSTFHFALPLQAPAGIGPRIQPSA
jgi:signal transduction histidine kinase